MKMCKAAGLLFLLFLNISSNANEAYFDDLRHYYQYDKTLPLDVQIDSEKSDARTTIFTFRSHDGETIHASVTRPPGYNPSKQYPLFVGDKTLLGQDTVSRHGFILANISLRLQDATVHSGLSNSNGSAPFATIWARLNSVIDYSRLLDYLESQYSIDKSKIIAGGRSRWGRIATILAANDPRIKGVIAASTSSDWLETVKTTQYEDFRKTVDQPWFTDDFYRQIMAPIDPKYFAKYVKVPVLVLHGEADKIVTPDGARRLSQALHPYSTLIIYPEVGHSIQLPKAIEDVEQWIASGFFSD